MLVEPRQRLGASVLVRVHTLPLLKHKGRLGQLVQRVLRLLLLGRLSSSGSGSRSSSFLLRLLLLLRRHELGVLLRKLRVYRDDTVQRLLVHDRVVVAQHVGVLATSLRTKVTDKEVVELYSHGDVSSREAVTHQKRVLHEVVVEVRQALLKTSPAELFNRLAVLQNIVEDAEKLDGIAKEHFIRKVDPLVNVGLRLGIGAEQVVVVRDLGDCRVSFVHASWRR